MKVLFIGAHCDDIELNCGATIAKYVRQGHQIHCIALSDCGEKGLSAEYFMAMESLGVSYHILATFEQRTFSYDRQNILEFLVRLKSENYDLVFTHSVNDIHQDHKVVAEETIRAFRGCDILSYCNPYNSLCMDENYFVDVDLHDVAEKCAAIDIYKTQLGKKYMIRDIVVANAQMRGIQAGCNYAEAFKVVRMKG